jgi:glycosyltransferase involved in cell wall biosynthesis
MSLLEILAVSLAEADERLSGCSIDRPIPGARAEARGLGVAGWVLGSRAPAVAVELLQDGAVLRRVFLRARPDVAAAFPDRSGTERCGFETTVAVQSPAAELELELRAVLRDRSRVPLGTIRARRRWRDLDDGAGGQLVSVVIPCYNQAHFLGEAIESALRQSHPHVEVVVVDDGSDDNTAMVAPRYPGVRCVRQDNQGLAAARNTGIRCSNGSYLVFLDADDRLLPDGLAAGLASLEAHPECAFVAGHHRLIAADGTPLPSSQPSCVQEEFYLGLMRAEFKPTIMTIMYRRAVFEAVRGFDTSLPACEDYELHWRIARQFPIHCHHRVVAEYRRHGLNMTHDSELMLKTTIGTLRAQWKYVKASRQYRDAYRIGLQFTQGWYGEPLADRVRNDLLAHQWARATRGMLALSRYYPRGLASVLSSLRR